MGKVISLHNYGGNIRKMAYRLKDFNDTEAMQIVAEEMAEHIEEGSLVMPVPSSSGHNNATWHLCAHLAAITGSKCIEPVDRIYPVLSSHMLRRMGLPGLSVAEHYKSMDVVDDIPAKGSIYIIDNVITTGSTVKAVIRHLVKYGVDLNRITPLIYAKITRSKKPKIKFNPDNPLRCCISGSRCYRNYDVIRDVLFTVPDDSIIVHGGARGADTIADEIARKMGFEVEVWEADWNMGRKAGPIRNRAMIKTCDFLFAFWDGESNGTLSAINEARNIGIPYEVFLD